MKNNKTPKDNQVETEQLPSLLQVMSRYLSVNSQHSTVLVMTVIFSLLSSATLGVMTLIFQSLIDSFGLTGSIFNVQTAILLISLAVLILSQYFQQLFGIKYSELCDRSMRVKTFSLLSHVDIQVLDTQRKGDILSRANSDLRQINDSLQNYFSVRLPQQIIGVVVFAVSLVINWQLTLFSLAIVPFFAILQMKITDPLTRFVRQRQEAAGKSLAIANNLMGGYEIAKAYNMGETLQQRYDATVDDVADLSVKANRATILLSPFSQILFFLPQIIICGFGVYLASINQITPGGIMSVLILSIFIRNPIGDFSSVLSNFKTAMGCASRVFELWDMPPEPSGGKETQPTGSSIVFSGVKFAYTDKPPVLSDLSFEISQGERIALVGASGSGKSTAIKLLMALYHKSSGEITIYGHPIEAWSITALRKQISYVGQDTYLFAGSIWDNITIGGLSVTDAQIQAVIDAAQLSDLDVRREIGEAGVHLSGGQRQRVAIARAMLKDSPLLLLDEPTSALDTQSEALVSEALQRLMQGRTTIIIAHRLSTLRGIDRILCMKDGQIAESGTHEQLMAMQGAYYSLYKSQEEKS